MCLKWMNSLSFVNNSSINVKVTQGKLVAIVGQVGAGKSSFVAAMLGEMEKLTGKVVVNVSIWSYNHLVKILKSYLDIEGMFMTGRGAFSFIINEKLLN